MPNENPPAKAPPLDPAAHNADIARKLEAQDVLANPNKNIDTTSALEALDKAAEAKSKINEQIAEETPPVVEAKPVVPIDENPPTLTEAETKAAEDKAKADAALKDAHDKYFKDSPGLPANASPKSSEAFSSIKIKAAQEISAREAELDKLRKEKADLEEKLKNPVPPELEKELEDHRNWRAKLDIEADPKFKEFDKSIAQSHEFIYAQLLKHPGITKEVIDEIKKYGGPERVNMSKIFDVIKDPTTQRLVESKMADIAVASYNKDQAIKLAKDNVKQYVDDRNKQVAAAINQHTDMTNKELNPMLGALDWFKEKPVDEKAAEDVKKSTADHNAFLAETKQQLSAALSDDSPKMRAILLTGMAQLFNIQRAHAELKSKLEAVTKERDEAVKRYQGVKSASTSRLRESAAPAGGVPRQKPAIDVNSRAGDALDDIAKQVMETKAAKAASGA